MTVCVANQNCVEAFRLMWTSFRHHHGEHPLFLWDNGSTDGCKELGQEWATRFVDGPVRMHGYCIDQLVKMVETPYVLVADNDIEVLEPFLDDMIAECEFCVCPPRRFDMGSCVIQDSFEGPVLCDGQERIDPCCALFHTEALQTLLRYTSFACYRSTQQAKHYDTGSMLYWFSKACGLSVKTPEWIWERVFHYGKMTWGLSAPEGTEDRMEAEDRYAIIRQRLAEVYDA